MRDGIAKSTQKVWEGRRKRLLAKPYIPVERLTGHFLEVTNMKSSFVQETNEVMPSLENFFDISSVPSCKVGVYCIVTGRAVILKRTGDKLNDNS